jgi:hypothetical protein
MTKTFIWTTGVGKKIPLQLMSDEHLKSAFERCMEIIIASEVDEKLKKYDKDARFSKMAFCGGEISTMKQSPLSVDDCRLWVERFIDESFRRGVRLPNVTRHNVEEKFKRKKLKKDLKLEANRNFDDKFKK